MTISGCFSWVDERDSDWLQYASWIPFLPSNFGLVECLTYIGTEGGRWENIHGSTRSPHTFASYLAMSGATLAELAEAMGHKTLAMVKRYAHLTEAHTMNVIARMTERFMAA